MGKRTRLKGFIQKPNVIKIRGLQAGKKIHVSNEMCSQWKCGLNKEI